MSDSPLSSPVRFLGFTVRLRFVVGGTARSGTYFASRLFTNLGYPCTHELWFNPGGDFILSPLTSFRIRWRSTDRRTLEKVLRVPLGAARTEYRRRRSGLVGESSCYSIPYLSRFSGLRLLQLRHPLDVIASLLGGRWMEWSSHWHRPGLAFIDEYVGLTGDPLTDACRCWIRWYEIGLSEADDWWRLEDLSSSRLATIMKRIDPYTDWSESAARVLREATPVNTAKDLNYEVRKPKLRWSDIPLSERPNLRSLASEVGYD